MLCTHYHAHISIGANHPDLGGTVTITCLKPDAKIFKNGSLFINKSPNLGCSTVSTCIYIKVTLYVSQYDTVILS